MNIVVTQTDIELAREAMVRGFESCGARFDIDQKKTCDCDLGRIDGCKERVKRIALAIATARKM